MMAYPTSAVVFTVKTAGTVIQPAHVNDLQTEVTALEGALLTTGLAHNLNPSADSTRLLGSSGTRWIIHGSQITPGTLPSTSISSGALSTAITVDGSQIVAGSIPSTVLSTIGTAGAATYLSGAGWTEPTINKVEYAIVSKASTQITVAGNWVGVTWDVQNNLSTAGMHSTTANSSRLVVVSTGLWEVGAGMSMAPNGGAAAMRIVYNDSTVVLTAAPFGGAIAAIGGYADASGLARCAAVTDYFTVQVFASSAVDMPSTVYSTPRFWMTRVST